MDATTERLDRDRKRREAYGAGVVAGMKHGEDGRNAEIFGELDDDDFFALNEHFDNGVTEGIARGKLTVEERLALIMDHYGSVDPAEKEDIPRQVKLGNRYVTVTQDDDDDYYLASYETLDDVWDGLADEVQGERSWWPHAIFDLHTGESIPYGVRVEVFRSVDPAAIIAEITSQGIA